MVNGMSMIVCMTSSSSACLLPPTDVNNVSRGKSNAKLFDRRREPGNVCHDIKTSCTLLNATLPNDRREHSICAWTVDRILAVISGSLPQAWPAPQLSVPTSQSHQFKM